MLNAGLTEYLGHVRGGMLIEASMRNGTCVKMVLIEIGSVEIGGSR